MLHLDLNNDGSTRTMKRITDKGDPFLIPIDQQTVNREKLLEKKGYVYLRLPPINPDVRAKRLLIRSASIEWNCPLSQHDQAVYVAFNPVYPPHLDITLEHLGDHVPTNQLIPNGQEEASDQQESDQQESDQESDQQGSDQEASDQEASDQQEETPTSPDETERDVELDPVEAESLVRGSAEPPKTQYAENELDVIASFNWRLTNRQASPLALLLDPIYVQTEQDLKDEEGRIIATEQPQQENLPEELKSRETRRMFGTNRVTVNETEYANICREMTVNYDEEFDNHQKEEQNELKEQHKEQSAQNQRVYQQVKQDREAENQQETPNGHQEDDQERQRVMDEQATASQEEQAPDPCKESNDEEQNKETSNQLSDQDSGKERQESDWQTPKSREV